MFNRKKKELRLQEQIAMIRPTSKSELKRQCLMLSHLDVDKAEKMYDFLVKDMEGIPDVEPASKSFMQNFGEQATGVFGWLRENQDMIGQGVDFIRGIIAGRKGGKLPPANPLPPINN
jgi:hypothetical protein